MTCRFIETAHYDTVTCHFGDDSVAVSFESSRARINKAKDERPVLQGEVKGAVV